MSEVGAVQATLAAEHAAVYVLGVLGAQTSQSASPALFGALSESYATHRGRRDHLTRLLVDLGVAPVATEPFYDVPEALGTTDAVNDRALELERSCSATYAYLVGSTTGEVRAWAVRTLHVTAVRELVFRGTPEMFPGNDEHADR